MRLHAWKPISLGIMLISLSACATGAPSSSVNVCRAIPLPHYTQAQKDRLAAEVDRAGNSIWTRFIRDYVTLYAAVKSCQKTR